jgi:hypothetical protein
MLAKVLAGDCSIVDYDMKFANKEITTLLPNQVKVFPVNNNAGSGYARPIELEKIGSLPTGRDGTLLSSLS